MGKRTGTSRQGHQDKFCLLKILSHGLKKDEQKEILAFQPVKSMVLNLFTFEGQTQTLPGFGFIMPEHFSG